ncbi:MAG TPA: copper chaperone PCu(A)C [Ignavibacteriaceae bacterium]|nr:copper chaperone PCu(A)C [Ignavibacteriaceae bacterium]
MNALLAILFVLFPSDDNIKIKDAWMRPSSEKMSTALYFVIENKSETADTLFQVDSDLAERVEIHETYSEGEMMGMRKVDFIVIEGKSTFELKPGAHHIMLMKLKKDINDGDKGEFVLHFKQAGDINVTAITKKPK